MDVHIWHALSNTEKCIHLAGRHRVVFSEAWIHYGDWGQLKEPLPLSYRFLLNSPKSIDTERQGSSERRRRGNHQWEKSSVIVSWQRLLSVAGCLWRGDVDKLRFSLDSDFFSFFLSCFCSRLGESCLSRATRPVTLTVKVFSSHRHSCKSLLLNFRFLD